MTEETESAKPEAATGASTPADGKSRRLTDEELESRREKQVSAWTMAAFAAAVVYLAIGDGVVAWKNGASFFAAFWAFSKSYLGVALIVGSLVGGVSVGVGSVRAALKAWGPYLLALVLGPIALWYWAGWYNFWRDVVIFVVVTIVVVLARRLVIALIAGSIARVWKYCVRLGLVYELSTQEAVARTENRPYTPEQVEAFKAAGRSRESQAYADLRASLGRPRAVHISLVLACLLGIWLLASSGDHFFGPRFAAISGTLPANATRFAETLNPRAAEWSKTPPARLGVALSGGGFRAALLHAGVLAALEERGIPIASLATVSGGSIIGGFYVAGGRPADFRDAVADGRFNLEREVVDFPNLIRLPCPGHVPVVDIKLLWMCSFSRVDVQANLLDRVLLGGKTVAELRRDRNPANPWWQNPPWWVAGATDLRYGQGVGLAADGVFRRAHAVPSRGLQSSGNQLEDLRRVPSDPIFLDMSADETFDRRRVAELIAVSGAFPGAFGSTVLAIGKDASLQIVDGGITDNLGYSLLMSALEREPKRWPLDMVLISDGGMPLSPESDVSAYAEFFRAMDVVYASSGILVKPNGVNRIWLSPRTIVPDALTEQDLARLPAALRARLGTLTAFRKDFERAQRIFLHTSTLKDRFREGWLESLDRRYWHTDKLPGGGEAVDALYTLGQYLVYINLADICRGLGRLDKC